MRSCVLALLVAATLGAAACSNDSPASIEASVQKSCLQRGFPEAVCACAAAAFVRDREPEKEVALESDAVARAIDGHVGRCMVSTGAYADDVEKACVSFAPLTQKVSETCACAAQSIARDERVRDVLDRTEGETFPLFAQSAYFTCALESGAIAGLLADTCGGNADGKSCACLDERFRAQFNAAALTGMSSETLRANATDLHERCLVDAPHIRQGIAKACAASEKKKGVCDCAVKRFLSSVPPGDVLAILQNGWSTDTMAELTSARRACGGGGKSRR